jgi:hypothetical protein
VPVVLYGCETWSLKLKEERRLRMFENMVLGRIFVPKRDEVTWMWRKLNNEDIGVERKKERKKIRKKDRKQIVLIQIMKNAPTFF